ncbi:MAG: tetratricopeptide repeat protein [Gammaproteobacteria bacterium]
MSAVRETPRATQLAAPGETQLASEATAHNDRATLLMGMGRYEEAIAVLNRAVQLDGSLAVAHSNLATCLNALRRLPEARASYRAAAAAAPQFIYPRVQALSIARELCDWRSWEQEVAELRSLQPTADNTAPQLDLLFLPLTPAELRQHAEVYAQAAGQAAAGGSHGTRRGTSRRVSIGYVSDEIRNHVVGSVLVEALELHDRNAFDIHLFDWGRPANTIVERRVRRAGIPTHDISKLNDRQAAELVASLGIDVLVDLKGYTVGHRIGLFQHRPAPVQLSWLGYPGTLGARCFDYIIADPFVIPAGEESGYTEPVLRLPSVLLPHDRQRPIADSGNRAVFGLPENAVVFCYLGRSGKIVPEVFADWLEIVSAVPDAVLWMRADNEISRANLIAEAAKRGLASERLIFYRESAHMRSSDLIARYRFADVALDSYPYGSHSTASDALWAGCPLVTRAGPTYASRVAGSLLTGAGLASLVTTTREDFRRVAIELGNTPTRLKELRLQLAGARQTSPIFDTPGFTRALERAYTEALRRSREGQPAAAFDVSVR